MPNVTIPNTFAANTLIKSAFVNANFTTIATCLNGPNTITRNTLSTGSAFGVVVNDTTGVMVDIAGNTTTTPKYLTSTGTGSAATAPTLSAWVGPLTTKGDLAGFSTVAARIPVGTNNQVLTADSAQTLGLKWANASYAAVAPTVQLLTSGSSATYTRPTTPTPLYLEVTMVGGGGGGAGSGSGQGAGGDGGATSFGTAGCNGGLGGVTGAADAPRGGYGGSLGTLFSTVTIASEGRVGGAGQLKNATNVFGGDGGASFIGASYGGNGHGSPPANSGSGGPGGVGTASFHGGGGGGSGAVQVGIITSPSSTYTYTIGAGGTAGAGATVGYAGATGYIIVREFYQ